MSIGEPKPDMGSPKTPEKQEDERSRVYKVGDVILDYSGNSAGGIEVIKGELYRFEGTNEEAGVLAHSVGSHGESTGIFANMKTTSEGEVANIICAPRDADMSIPQNYKDIEEGYYKELEEL